MNRSEELFTAVRESGFAHWDGLIHLFVGGSELHGAKVKDTDDLDIYGLYLEPPELVLGLHRSEFFVWSTAGDERRNGPDDVDVTLYSLRKWAGLAVKGSHRLTLLVCKEPIVAHGALAGHLTMSRHFFIEEGGGPVQGLCRRTSAPTKRDRNR